MPVVLEFILYLLLLVVGFFLLIKGADYFVDGASAIAKKLKVPTLIIGLTIVALGTSLPEFAVSSVAAINYNITQNIGELDLSIGNVIGSNIFNTLVVLGATCLIVPIAVEKKTMKFEMPFMLAITLLLCLACFLGQLYWYFGLIFVILLVFYIWFLIYRTKKEMKEAASLSKEGENEEENKESNEEPQKGFKGLIAKWKKACYEKVWVAIIFLVGGAAAIAGGGEAVNISAKYIAEKCGMDEQLIGLTIVALGTSLPELFTSTIAAKKGENDIALGNVLGSNILNILFILGITSLYAPLTVQASFRFDIIYLIFISVVLFIMMFVTMKDKGLFRICGSILLGLYVIYMAYIICRNYNALPDWLYFGLKETEQTTTALI